MAERQWRVRYRDGGGHLRDTVVFTSREAAQRQAASLKRSTSATEVVVQEREMTPWRVSSEGGS